MLYAAVPSIGSIIADIVSSAISVCAVSKFSSCMKFYPCMLADISEMSMSCISRSESVTIVESGLRDTWITLLCFDKAVCPALRIRSIKKLNSVLENIFKESLIRI